MTNILVQYKMIVKVYNIDPQGCSRVYHFCHTISASSIVNHYTGQSGGISKCQKWFIKQSAVHEMLEQKSILKLTFLMIWVFNFTSSFMLVFALLILKNKISWINTWQTFCLFLVTVMTTYIVYLSVYLSVCLQIDSKMDRQTDRQTDRSRIATF